MGLQHLKKRNFIWIFNVFIEDFASALLVIENDCDFVICQFYFYFLSMWIFIENLRVEIHH